MAIDTTFDTGLKLSFDAEFMEAFRACIPCLHKPGDDREAALQNLINVLANAICGQPETERASRLKFAQRHIMLLGGATLRIPIIWEKLLEEVKTQEEKLLASGFVKKILPPEEEVNEWHLTDQDIQIITEAENYIKMIRKKSAEILGDFHYFQTFPFLSGLSTMQEGLFRSRCEGNDWTLRKITALNDNVLKSDYSDRVFHCIKF